MNLRRKKTFPEDLQNKKHLFHHEQVFFIFIIKLSLLTSFHKWDKFDIGCS